MTEKLRFFVDPAWRNTALPHTPLLYPFWGISLDASRTPFQHALFSRYQHDTSLYEMTEDLRRADGILLPYNHTILRRQVPCILSAGIELSKKSGKPLIIDALTDLDFPVAHENSVILRYGGYRFRPDSRVIVLPLYADDLHERFRPGPFTPREKHAIPKIGFAGWGTLTLSQRIRATIKEVPDRIHGIVDSRYRACKKGVFFREEVMRTLSKSDLVETNFLARPSYSGHIHTASNDLDTLRRQFVENLEESDYGLDVRGDANASMRLFEMLSLGVIPVLIDTERLLPFEKKIDYHAFALHIDFRDIQKAPRIIRSYHDSLSNEQFQQMQESARTAYVEWFRVDAMSRHLMDELRLRLKILNA